MKILLAKLLTNHIWNYCFIFQTILSTKCPCQSCSITAMIWTKSNCLLTGCSRGRLCYWSPNLKCISNSIMHNGEIINVKLSAAEDKLVTSGVDKHVNVYAWPSTISCLQLKYVGPVKVRFQYFVVLLH